MKGFEIMGPAGVYINEVLLDSMQLGVERLRNLALRVIKGAWGCIVCQSISGFQVEYLDCQYFIFHDTRLSFCLTEPAFILRTHTKNWFPWILNGSSLFPARFEDEGGLLRLPAGKVAFDMHAGNYRTSDFFFDVDFIKGYKEAYRGLNNLLSDSLASQIGCLGMPFLVDHVQWRILKDIQHIDTSLTIVKHFITVKSTEYLMRAMGQIHDRDGLWKEYLPAREKEVAERIAEILRERLDEHLSLRTLAQSVGSNTVYIQGAFKAHYGMTIHKFQMRLRLERAKYLLIKETNETYENIALMVGYCDASAFSKAFKEAFGVRPREFKKTAVSNGREPA